MTAERVSLPGLDAQNPLGFFAALGLLRVLDTHARRHELNRPWLRYPEGTTTPELGANLTLPQVVQIVLEDAREQHENPLLNLAYTDDGHRTSSDHEAARRDLKPRPDLARQVLEEAADADRRTADLAAGVFSELVQDNNGNTKPTAFHFTAGQQAFLQMVDDLRTGITPEHLLEALCGPWLNSSTLPSLAWDSTVSRLYALRARDPAGEKRGSVPGANWLGVHALAFFPVVVTKQRLVTTCVMGGWKTSVFTWPTWTARLTVPLISALLRINLRNLTAKQRAAAGIDGVFESKILRSDQGGYGSFSPANVVVPAGA